MGLNKRINKLCGRRTIFYALLAFMLMLGFPRSLRAQQPVFKKGDRVCFVGNSITYNGGFFHQIALYYATRYPDMDLEMINCGVPGNVAAQVIARMDSDILANKPTICVLKLGMNDVDKTLYTKQAGAEPGIEARRQQALDTYQKNYESIIQTLLKYCGRVILQTPTIYDETAALADVRLPGRNHALKKCAAIVKEFGVKYNLKVVDYWGPMDEIGRKYQQADSTRTIIGPDRVHPGAMGHFIMAYEFLKSTEFRQEVSSLQLSAVHLTGPVQVNGMVTAIQYQDGGISFNWKEGALPFPVADDAKPALELVPFIPELNRENLKVTGLKAGNYQILVDGKQAGTYSGTQLSAGINLSQNSHTPQYAQSVRLLGLFQELWQLESKVRYVRALEAGRMRARNYSVAGAEDFFAKQITAAKDTTTTAYKNLLSFQKDYMPVKRQQADMILKMKALHGQIYVENKPVAHHYEIIKQ
ncbi:GDSL-like lipase/acylhydrolase family protein [Mucilaginibacter gracilis]|uniref:GDSL-like lipase/acylhydrolase family protein n=1 Tax=Mucilaginibacter gracilis TaxID=423350 RepID=A0A495IV93_9SPHI|nr:SGNH/GDSL hydrolase family protein [Mucilaginibacter gracilis]RKR79934.1 GDSL-like lipase/acylhydrolase family protein [Mucilaginibacter gracilis]